MLMTYEQALALFWSMVNQKHPPQMGAAQNRDRWTTNEANTCRGGRGHGRGGFGRGGRGSCNRGGRSGQRRQTRSDSRMMTLTDGPQIEYHTLFSFP